MWAGKTYRRIVTITLILGLWLWVSFQEGDNGSANGKSYALISNQITLCIREQLLPWYYLEAELAQLYAEREHAPIWYSNGCLRLEAAKLLQQLEQSHRIGLMAKSFPISKIRIGLHPCNDSTELVADSLALADVRLTASALVYLSQLKHGMTRTHQIWNDAKDSIARRDVQYQLDSLLWNFDQTLRDNQPSFVQYVWFKQHINSQMEQLIEFEKACQLMRDENKDVLTYACAHPEFEELLYDLWRWTGFLMNSPDDLTLPLEEVLASYMVKEHLINKSSANLRRQIISDFFATMEVVQLNLDRLKTNAPEGGDYIWINVPASELIVYETNFPVQRHLIVVGQPQTPTPVISGPMQEIVTFPQWNIPRSIVVKEISPAMRRNKGYLARKGYEVVDHYGNALSADEIDWELVNKDYVPFRVIQEPGYRNALGVIKFNFINKYSIYLHDTNTKRFFKRRNRALSHGCIRVENPLELAKYLLSDYSYKLFRENLIQNETNHFRVEKGIPVYLRYLTCDVNPDGHLILYNDVYQKDDAALKALWSSLPKWPPATHPGPVEDDK